MKKYNYIASGFFIAMSCYILYETCTYKVSNSGQGNPAIWPRYLAIAMIVLSVLLIIETLIKKGTEKDSDGTEARIDWKSPGMIKVYLALAMVAGFIVVMNIFGMLIGLILLIPSIMWLMSCKNKVMYVILPIAVVTFVYFFFIKIMTITLPGGIFF
ncbi:MAG: tripartite tricarboxylate transporter TctB family protein [Oscillospiraceae bacterium]